MSYYDNWLSAPYDDPKVDEESAREMAERQISGYTYEELVACLPTHKQKCYKETWDNLREEAIEEMTKEFKTIN